MPLKYPSKYQGLFDACDTFARVANIIDALPNKPYGATPCREVFPGGWPTVEDLRRLRDEMVALGWTRDYDAPKQS